MSGPQLEKAVQAGKTLVSSQCGLTLRNTSAPIGCDP